jgi:hypothetical protein
VCFLYALSSVFTAVCDVFFEFSGAFSDSSVRGAFAS